MYFYISKKIDIKFSLTSNYYQGINYFGNYLSLLFSFSGLLGTGS